MNDNCLICFEELNDNIIYPLYCNCKIKLHIDCEKKMRENNFFCPICRIKIIQTIELNNNIVQPSISWYCFYLFNKYPNIATFVICLFLSLVITVIYIIPLLLFQGVNYYINKSP